jgi:hypothetical protein
MIVNNVSALDSFLVARSRFDSEVAEDIYGA